MNLVFTRRPVVGGADVLPPWKQGDVVSETTYTSKTSVTSVSSSITQLGQEQRWEQQVTEVRGVGLKRHLVADDGF